MRASSQLDRARIESGMSVLFVKIEQIPTKTTDALGLIACKDTSAGPCILGRVQLLHNRGGLNKLIGSFLKFFIARRQVANRPIDLVESFEMLDFLRSRKCMQMQYVSRLDQVVHDRYHMVLHDVAVWSSFLELCCYWSVDIEKARSVEDQKVERRMEAREDEKEMKYGSENMIAWNCVEFKHDTDNKARPIVRTMPFSLVNKQIGSFGSEPI